MDGQESTSITNPADLRVGERVELVRTDDAFTRLRPGDRGTVVSVRDSAYRMIEVAWDTVSTLAMLPDEGDELKRVAR